MSNTDTHTYSILSLSTLRKIMYIGLGLTVLVVSFHWFASDNALYWIFKWLDIPMHIIGGLLASLGVIWLIASIVYVRTGRVLGKRAVWYTGLIGAFVVGVLWEFLEAYYGLSGLSAMHRVDTIADIINDMIGGICGVLLWYKLSR